MPVRSGTATARIFCNMSRTTLRDGAYAYRASIATFLWQNRKSSASYLVPEGSATGTRARLEWIASGKAVRAIRHLCAGLGLACRKSVADESQRSPNVDFLTAPVDGVRIREAKQMGEASWPLSYLVICLIKTSLIKILARNAVSRLPRRPGSRMGRTGPRISGSAPRAVTGSSRSRSSPQRSGSPTRSRLDDRGRAVWRLCRIFGGTVAALTRWFH